MIVCVAGNPAIDKLFEVDAVRRGEIHRPDAFIPLPGGKGIHVAQVATALGADAIATGILGGHHGRWLAETLAEEGVPGVFAWAPAGETRSCLTVADRATGGLTEFYEDGIRATPQDWAGLASIVDELLAQGPSWLAMAGSVPAAPGVQGYAQLVRAARAAGVRSAVDSRGPDLARAIDERPDLVKINGAEACELLATPRPDDIAQRTGGCRGDPRAGGRRWPRRGHHARRAGHGVGRPRRGRLARRGGGARRLPRRQRGRVPRRPAHRAGGGGGHLPGGARATPSTTPARGRGPPRSASARRRPTPRSPARLGWIPRAHVNWPRGPSFAGCGADRHPSLRNPSPPTD